MNLGLEIKPTLIAVGVTAISLSTVECFAENSALFQAESFRTISVAINDEGMCGEGSCGCFEDPECGDYDCDARTSKDVIRDDNGKTALHIGVLGGKIDGVRKIVELNPKLILEKDGKGQIPLSYACELRSDGKIGDEIVELLQEARKNYSP